MRKNKIETNPYGIRLGPLKARLEKRAVEKGVKVPELIRAVLSDYLEVEKQKQTT